MKKIIERITPISINNGYISFQYTSELYNVTDAGGQADIVLKNGFVPLGDGNDYVLTNNDKKQIRRLLKK